MGKRIFIWAIRFIIPVLIVLFWYEQINTHTVLTKNIKEKEMIPLIQEFNLKVINDLDYYHGKESYYVMIATDQSGKKRIIWLNQKTKDFRSEWLEQGFLPRNLEAKLTLQSPDERIMRIVPGIEENRLIWEATTRNKSGSYSYYLFDFYTGELWRSYKMRNWSQSG
jgi:uncharacterized protein YpmB